MEKKTKVLIIGAGLSGLTLAHELQKLGISYTIIEARERMGGRIHTVRTSSGNTIEMGATWFHSQHRNLMALVEELGVAYEKQYMGNSILYDFDNHGRTIQQVPTPQNGEPSFIFSKGTISLLDSLYEQLDASQVFLGEQVETMSYEDKLWKVTTSSRTLEAKVVVNTLPPNLFVGSITVLPQLPVGWIAASQSTHTWMGESIKVGVEMSEDSWRNKGIGAFFSQFGPASELHDHTHQAATQPSLKGFALPYFHELNQEERKHKFFEQLRLYKVIEEDSEPAYFELDWQDESFTYSPYFNEVYPHQNNGNPLFRKSLFDNSFYFAGSETAREHPGYMDGAVERGKEVADVIAQLN